MLRYALVSRKFLCFSFACFLNYKDYFHLSLCRLQNICSIMLYRLSMLTMERVSPFLLHLPEDIKPDELFNCIAQVLYF